MAVLVQIALDHFTAASLDIPLGISPTATFHNSAVQLTHVQRLLPKPRNSCTIMKSLRIFQSSFWCWSFLSIVDMETDQVFPKPAIPISKVLLSSVGIIGVSNHRNSAQRPPEECSGFVLLPPYPKEAPLEHATRRLYCLSSGAGPLPSALLVQRERLLVLAPAALSHGRSFLLQQELCHCRRRPAGDLQMGF